MATLAIEVSGLTFSYRDAQEPALRDLTWRLSSGTRCLLIGANGAGKSTLLNVLAGRHMVEGDQVLVLGRPAFHDTSLVADRAHLGEVFPFVADIRVSEILSRQAGVDATRQARLIDILGVDVSWRMHQVSSGQRRRVQILLSLLRPVQLLLLDEVTTDLDLVARADLLAFLREESEQRGAAIVYATHVLDSLERWATHLAYIANGKMSFFGEIEKIPELAELRAQRVDSPLARVMESWLRRDVKVR